MKHGGMLWPDPGLCFLQHLFLLEQASRMLSAFLCKQYLHGPPKAKGEPPTSVFHLDAIVLHRHFILPCKTVSFPGH